MLRSRTLYSVVGSLNSIANMLATHIRNARTHRPSDMEAPVNGIQISDAIGELEQASVAAHALAAGIDETLRLLRMELADTERGSS